MVESCARSSRAGVTSLGAGIMDTITLTQSPFAVLTFIVAPALLTNASTVLALSTTNRMLRTRERMQELFAKSETGKQSEPESARLIEQVNRVERQAVLLLRALRSIYVALGALDRKSTRLNSSHTVISYAVFCLKKKKKQV